MDSREALDRDQAGSGAFFDGTEPGGQRSDTIMIARVDPDEEKVDMVSLPRDLWVPIAGTGANERINTAYSEGRQALIDTIEGDFDIAIHHYIEVDFAGFKGLVESIDGVPMYFDTAMRDQHSGLFVAGEGCLTLDGGQALSLARSRQLEYFTSGIWVTDPTGDLGRISRQQTLVLEAISRATSLDLNSPARISRIIDVGIKNIGVDPNLTFDDMAGLAARFRTADRNLLHTHILPVDPYTTAGGAAVLALRETQAEPIFEIFRGVEHDGLMPTDVKLAVVNGSGTEGQAASVAQALEYVGFGVTTVGGLSDIDEQAHEQTQIRFHPDDQERAMTLATHLSAGALLVEDDSLETKNLLLVTGTDFSTVTEQPIVLALPPTPVDADDVAPLATTTTVTPAEGNGDGDTIENGDDSSPTSGDAVGRTPGRPPRGLVCS